jgi:hypothetical protein
METPLQEYISWIEEMENSAVSLTLTETDFKTLRQFKQKAISLLEREKQVIIEAYIEHANKTLNTSIHKHNVLYDERKEAEQYYNETFNEIINNTEKTK